ncbi:MAG: tRNA uridine-5-carboxymethylaminomethyl(34) synthesis GTPase MnmE [Saprospiraceae bacterium]|nr:tRNA uridine-5-carboxymethylaminomethyl(34) synthesis GTPase MnmE [Saprospiraceae bacterium]
MSKMFYAQHNLKDTIVALATPPGVGAIGVIRLSGEDAIFIVNQVFQGKHLTLQASHTIHFGTIKEEEHLIDEVLVSLFVAPKSYTGENVAEVSCHGSPYIIQQLIQLFIKKGARLAQPGEFTLRAFLNGRMDLSQAEAVADLIASESESSHAVAMQQMRGGFSNEIKHLREELIHFASMIELELDFGEEDVEFANRDDLKELILKIQKLIYTLVESFQLGNVIKNGVSTVIAGRPNAGKSTLLNALLNEERAIVSEIEGTTRDTIEEVLNIKGIHFRLIDTAGVREAQDQIEAIGVEKTMQKIQQSALLVYVFDVIKTPPEEVHKDLEKLVHPGVQLLVVANKMDLNPYTKVEHYLKVQSTKYEVGTGEAEFGNENSEMKNIDSDVRNANSHVGNVDSHIKTPDSDEKNIDSTIEIDNSHKRTADSLNGISDSDYKTENTDAGNDKSETGNIPPSPSPAEALAKEGITRNNFVPISAINQMNIEYLKEKLYETALSGKVNLENTIVTNARHYEALQKASEALDTALKGLNSGITGDFLAMDIRRALVYLGEITGEVGVEDLLEHIFSKFCIGK